MKEISIKEIQKEIQNQYQLRNLNQHKKEKVDFLQLKQKELICI
jgi:hypothetical protein